MPVSGEKSKISQNSIVSIERIAIDQQKKDEYIPLGCLFLPWRGGWTSSFPVRRV